MLQKLQSQTSGGLMSLLDMFSGGAFSNASIFVGYAVYKPMINGRICQFYVNPSIKDDGEAETLRTNERENGHERE